jgi:hypothetical protein
MGKSAILAAWLARREAAGATVPHHFIRCRITSSAAHIVEFGTQPFRLVELGPQPFCLLVPGASVSVG